jgi:hypothetical protein
MSEIRTEKKVEVEESLESLSRYMDGLFRVPGTNFRFGLYILYQGARYGVPKITLVRMAFNLALDYVVGIIPFLGDAFDFVWKANKQNMELIRERGAGAGKGTTGDYLFVFGLMGLVVAILVGAILISFYFVYRIIWELWTGNI